MLRKTPLLCVALTLAVLVVTASSSPAAGGNDKFKGTVIHLTNGTDKAMCFFVEFRTADGQTRNFINGLYLRPGQTGTFTAEPNHTVVTRRKNGLSLYQIRVRAFRGRLESLLFA